MELQAVTENRDKLVVALTFNMSWVAGEMNKEGLLSHPDYEEVTYQKSLHGERDKTLTMVKSLMKKKDSTQYREAIDSLEKSLRSSTPKESCPPAIHEVISPIISLTAGASTSGTLSQPTPMITAHTSEDSSSHDLGTPPPPKRIHFDESVASSTHENMIPLEFDISLENGQEIREYQHELAKPGLQGKNYIFVAPTGSGKTLVAAMVIASHLKSHSKSRVAFIVPTKPLADQQMKKLKFYIPDALVSVYTGGEFNDSKDLVMLGESRDHISVCTAGKFLEEVRQSRVKFSQFSMLILDECHHTVKEHAYAKLMKLYLEEFSTYSLQIVGMTASLGAGSRSNITEHLKCLAAHLDATGGIISVKNPSDLGKFNREPSRTLEVLKTRGIDDDFINEVCTVMKQLEKFVSNFQACDHKKWSQEYETFVMKTKQTLEASSNSEFRDQISTLSELQKYCTALSVYMDFRKPDAIKVMKGTSDLPDDHLATSHESFLKETKLELLSKLRSLQEVENPLLGGMEKILIQKFANKPSSRAIIFVRTKNHTFAMKKWISSCTNLKEAGIVSDLITGYTGRGDDMNRERQQDVMRKFHDGSINLLVATSVAEEGLDIPECNLVIRYQHVSSEISQVQAEGRARADDSDCYTIVSSESNLASQEIKNNALILQVTRLLEDSSVFTDYSDIRKLQEKIIQDKKQKDIQQRQSKIYPAYSVTLICKKCKEEVCSGGDIFTLEEDDSHHMVDKEKLRMKFSTEKHDKPILISRSLLLTHKMNCLCKNKWGDICCSTTTEQQYHLLTCKGFTFKIGSITHLGKKWCEVPFQIPSVSERA